MTRRRPLLASCAILLALGSGGCGDDPIEPPLEVYVMALEPVTENTEPDGTIRNVYRATVTDGGNIRIAEAWMLFQVTAGDVIPQTDRTDISGNGRVEWVLDPVDYAGLTTATLSGCAQNLAPPDCEPEPLVTLTFE